MGCAFSSTQIFLVDSKQIEKKGSDNNNNNNNFVRSLLFNAWQGFNRSYVHKATVIGSGGALLLATKCGKDVILVGQLKSNGTYSRRRPSSEAKFIEQKRKLSNSLCQNRKDKEENNSIFHRNKQNRLADSTTCIGDNIPISVPIDFQKRLESLKIKRNDENKINNCEDFKNEKKKISQKECLKTFTVEKEFIMHRAERESIITEGGLDHQLNEWDTLSNTTLSADCCSQIGGRIGLQQKQLHDGDVSEASFVLVKRKLKIAWEYHQIRKQSFLRKEKTITENNCDILTAQPTTNIRRLSNNWIPEITKLID
ncbi:hypothetical protein ACQ4LE_002414 [Meloidogyne hapla]